MKAHAKLGFVTVVGLAVFGALYEREVDACGSPASMQLMHAQAAPTPLTQAMVDSNRKAAASVLGYADGTIYPTASGIW